MLTRQKEITCVLEGRPRKCQRNAETVFAAPLTCPRHFIEGAGAVAVNVASHMARAFITLDIAGADSICPTSPVSVSLPTQRYGPPRHDQDRLTRSRVAPISRAYNAHALKLCATHGLFWRPTIPHLSLLTHPRFTKPTGLSHIYIPLHRRSRFRNPISHSYSKPPTCLEAILRRGPLNPKAQCAHPNNRRGRCSTAL